MSIMIDCKSLRQIIIIKNFTVSVFTRVKAMAEWNNDMTHRLIITAFVDLWNLVFIIIIVKRFCYAQNSKNRIKTQVSIITSMSLTPVILLINLMPSDFYVGFTSGAFSIHWFPCMLYCKIYISISKSRRNIINKAHPIFHCLVFFCCFSNIILCFHGT